VNDTAVTAVTPAGTAGAATVSLTTSGGSASLANAFIYYISPPTISSVSPSTGPPTGGTAITITGTNLTGTTSVTVGGAAATAVVAVNSTTVTAVTPAGTVGARDVVVSTAAGNATLIGAFVYQLSLPWATVLEPLPDPAVVFDTNLRAKIVAAGYPWRVRDHGTGIEMVLVPKGTFGMGCSEPVSGFLCDDNELPTHQVILTSPFYLSRYEVTQAQWTAVMGSNPSSFQSASAQVPASEVPNRPVENVPWNDIQHFLTVTGLRLPTEAQWEYAYRAGTTTAYHGWSGLPAGSNNAGTPGIIAWNTSNGSMQTHPVGRKPANSFGLHDMAGNVGEWVSDWYDNYSSLPQTNPTGPAFGTWHIRRGGSVAEYDNYYEPRQYTAAARTAWPEEWVQLTGLRVARWPWGASPPFLNSVAPNASVSTGGGAITITGTNLTGTSSVTIGGNHATSVVVLNDTTVTAVAPAGTVGAHDVVVSTPAGSATLTDGFVYHVAVPWATVLEGPPDATVVVDPDLRAQIMATGHPWRVRDNGTGIEMMLVPSGSFDMGCSASNAYSCNSDENPVHQVIITQPFYMSRTEVTQAQWTAVMGSNPSSFQSSSAQVPPFEVSNRPVEQVSWHAIQVFLSSTGMRLPTEAEWEYAYRAGTTTAFHGFTGHHNGTNDDTLVGNIAWHTSNSSSQPHPVGKKAANGFGLHDMSGNVWEWVNDRYADTYSASSPSTNPLGPATGSHHVARGGSWNNSSHWGRSSKRAYGTPSFTHNSLGFRIARHPLVSPPSVDSVAPNVGPSEGGTPITITGTNLTGTSAVTIGGVAATSVSVVNSTTVTAVTPAGTAGEKLVRVTTPGGTASLSSGFTYSTGVWYTVLAQNPDPVIVTNATLRDAITATGYPWRVRDNGTGIEMVLIPPGSFDMGCSASDLYGCSSVENPVHTVALTNAFYLGRYEVTQAQWQAKMGLNPSFFQSASTEVPAAQVPNRPVETVSWNTVQGFLTATGLRLPSEAEWEYAYRAGTTTAFHGFTGYLNGTNDDTQVGNIAWYTSNSSSQPRPVGQKAANGFGLYDMSGNVAEWVSDWLSSTYYTSSLPTNPLGPATGSNRGLRGGSCFGVTSLLRSSVRSGAVSSGSDRGFRVARSAPASPPVVGAVAPSVGPMGGGTTITITGVNLYETGSIMVDGSAATSVVVVNDTTVTAVTPAGAAGAANVSLTTPYGSATANGAFTYQWYGTPTIALVSPSSGPLAGGTAITITGTNLAGTSSVTIDGVAATSVVILNDTTVTAVTPGGTAGPKTVSLTTQDGVANRTNGFTYQLYGTPTISSVSPTSGPLEGGTEITIRGTHLTGTTSVRVGGAVATEVVVANDTMVTALTPASTPGAKTVSVTNPDGTANLTNGFTYVLGPTIWGVSPNVGLTAGGTAITITGTNLAGTSSVTIGGVAATSVVAVNNTTVTAVTPAGAAGAANLSLTTPYGSATASGAFTYQLYGTPTIASVTPNSGPLAGGTAITITGTNLAGTSSVTIGGVAATSVVAVNNTTVTAVTPAGIAGANTVSVTTPDGTANLTNGFTYASLWYTVLEQHPDPTVVPSATLRNAITATGYPWRVRDDGTGIEMVLIPLGTFDMGCSASIASSCASAENPVHTVTLTNAFYLGRYEVTQAQWQAKMGSNPSSFQSASTEVPVAQVPNRPVETVSWNTIQGFLMATDMRLPTEAEWEYACRAGTMTAFHGFTACPNGANDETLVGSISWYYWNSSSQTRPVGQKAANGLGLHDMAGNVSEWVNDWFGTTYYASSPPTNPPGPASGTYRVLRGGSWNDSSNFVRSSHRDFLTPSISNNRMGFRVARAPL
jgi:formylglycine-generating enzyme required for sulfatase activity